MPSRRKGRGFFGDLVKKGSHGLVDFLADKAGLGMPKRRRRSGGALTKGSAEAKARMAIVRSYRRKGGSFKPSGY